MIKINKKLFFFEKRQIFFSFSYNFLIFKKKKILNSEIQKISFIIFFLIN